MKASKKRLSQNRCYYELEEGRLLAKSANFPQPIFLQFRLNLVCRVINIKKRDPLLK